ncbi:dihydrofolate reductase family protein [Spirillospora sp. CA-294931]|uniref:dihydrofolate reductase family protein n=1 Tax=Spirillospora sp. CA-294931 TaxID=3240042 RepID=UPI003D8B9C61
MRKLIVTNIISLDGYYEGPGGDVMVMPFDDAFDEYNAERLRAADTLLLGRVSFEGFKGFWPQLADDATVRPVIREISRLNNAIGKVVVSDTLTPEEAAPWDEGTEIVPRDRAHARLAEIKQGPGRDILTFGSRTLWNDLLMTGLVDELHFMIGAAFLGGGTPVFDGAPASLTLLEARPLNDSPLVLARYAPA